MTIEALMCQPVTVITPASTTDEYGNSIDDWDNASTVSTLAWIAQVASEGASEEITRFRQAEISEWNGYFRPTITIGPRDRVVRGSVTFEVDGPVNPAYRYNVVHHVEVPLKVVEG